MTPEALDAVDVCRASRELIAPVVNPEVLRVADIDEPVVAAPAVGVDDRVERHPTADYGQKRALPAVRHDLGVDAAVSFEDAEDDGLARGSAPTLAPHAPGAEVRLIHLDLAAEGRLTLALFGDAFTDSEKDRGDALARQAGQLRHVGGREVEREVAHDLAEFTLRYFRPPVVAV